MGLLGCFKKNPADETETRHVWCNLPERNIEFPSNKVSNTKYTALSFIPKNLAEQFSRHINRYFLFIAFLQLISVITPVSPISTFGPLLVIFAVSAIKELVDDRGRAAADRLFNGTKFTVIRDGGEKLVCSSEIHVGDLVRLKENDQVPCDLALIETSSANGTCYIQTANLDGETNLKCRIVPAKIDGLTRPQVDNFRGVVECAHPNSKLYEFNSRMWVDVSGVGPGELPSNAESISLSGEQFIQQTTMIRNTEYITGVAVYTGNETKFSRNKDNPPIKWTKADALINKLAIMLFIFQILLVVVLGYLGLQWKEDYGRALSYLRYPSKDDEEFYVFLIIPARFLLLNSTIIPISMKVTLDLCKLFYAKFINWDMQLHEPGEEPAKANNTSINEDLGQIEYVLTDKTGTLTQNVMVFKLASIQGKVYSLGAQKSQEQLVSRAFTVHSMKKALDEGNEEVFNFLLNIVLNNGIIPDHKDGKIVYKGPSPDEEALVQAAADIGFVLLRKDGPNIDISYQGVVLKYLVCQELEFSSDRRRSSMVIRDLESGGLHIFTKGADDRIFARLADTEDSTGLNTDIESFAKEGLRTLVFGYRTVDDEEFIEWLEIFQKANSEIHGREEAVAKACEIIEHGFLLTGASAIEDKLQDGVPETIADLRAAGIKFWMLTGDKYTTAVQIANSCNLKQIDGPNTRLFEINGDSEQAVGVCINDALRNLDSLDIPSDYNVTVILRGRTLPYCLDKDNVTWFLKLTTQADAVICCRFLPRQKADIVKLVRDAGHMTLAIGDGGNDVVMIQAAHIGVGIRGKEGLQAARASDFQFNYFRYLKRLLLVHGRSSYLRTAFVAQYSYYKSFLFCFFQIAFAYFSGFSGSSLFNSACITAYNSVLFFPIVTYVFDRDLSPETVGLV